MSYTTASNNSPSFSSSLLEQIYRSFDTHDDDDRIDIETHYSRSRRSTKLPKRSAATETDYFTNTKHFEGRAVDRYVLQQWMEKEKKRNEKEKEKLNMMNSGKYRRNSMPEDVKFRHPLYSSSSTSSSDSSSGIGGFSSSDTDSVKTSLKPIRTAEFNRKSFSGESPAAATTATAAKTKKSKKEGKLQHALKLYGDLKKVKQPLSPGGKLASFLNSLFANSKKPKTEPKTTEKISSSSVPSTATSYSRSCLSKTPSSAGRFERRSVRFCPVSVVVDETGQKSVYNDDVSRMETCGGGGGGGDDELRSLILEKQRRVEEVAKELLKNYRSNNNNNNQIRKELKVNIINPNINHGNNNSNHGSNNVKCGDSKWDKNSRNSNVNLCGFEDEDEDDDEESCCSSDLFELDNILEVGVSDKYCQELPVYETTHVSINRAIANGSIL